MDPLLPRGRRSPRPPSDLPGQELVNHPDFYPPVVLHPFGGTPKTGVSPLNGPPLQGGFWTHSTQGPSSKGSLFTATGDTLWMTHTSPLGWTVRRHHGWLEGKPNPLSSTMVLVEYWEVTVSPYPVGHRQCRFSQSENVVVLLLRKYKKTKICKLLPLYVEKFVCLFMVPIRLFNYIVSTVTIDRKCGS